MPEHGQHDEQSQKWFCGYWMTAEEWEDVHDYAPFVKPSAEQEGDQQQEDEEQERE